MKKSAIIIILSLLFAIVSQGKEKRPNILLLISDQHAGAIMTQTGYQYVKTPGLDKLAEEGVTFTRSYCTYPVCVASRASFLTGLMPSTCHGDQLTTYPSIGTVMKDVGYETAYYGKWHVSNTKIRKVGAWHGFESYKDERKDSIIAQMTIDFLNQERDKPFFVISSYMNPHDCCELARNISGLGDDYHDGPVEEKMDVDKCPPLPDNFSIPQNEAQGFYCRRTPDSTDMANFRKHPVKYWGETEWRQYMYGYDRLIEKVDNHMLNVVNTLEEKGLLENTIIFYTSDHGDGHAAHNWNQKMTFYEESVNIPFIVSWKGKTKAGVIDSETLTSNGLDLYPTICKLAGISPDDSLPGIDMSPWFMKGSQSTKNERKYVVSEINQTTKIDNKKKIFVGRMVVSERFKYFLFDGGENPEQLFDLKNDPGEMHSIVNSNKFKGQLLAHRNMLKEWISKTGDNFSIEIMKQ